ncbi:MAG: AAA family ATPase [Deltaproteobacteria bacterium]|jgi:ATP-dependent DNA helicase RecG|nr:AAA family ATPase [Deltaproteobacteria bacterium]MBT5176938.1 AAA family ATPase [Candidatus Neomarinimicrobiota bacterium]MBT6637049.1 AAA family ATPase [Candidatus Neomarinimicrobiota bacterium]
MNSDQINQILSKGEGKRIEYKESKNALPSDLYDSIVSLANTEGGTVILGADNDGNTTGINPENTVQFISDIATALNSPDCVSPSLFLAPESIEHTDVNIIIIDVHRSSVLHNHAGRIYWRDGDADLDITDDQSKISELYFQKRNSFSEAIIYPALNIEDLSDNLFQQAKAIIRGLNANHPWLSISFEQLLREASLFVKDFHTGKEGLTLGAALIFGEDSVIQNILPAYKVEAMVRRDNVDRWDDRITLRTNLIHTYQKLLEFIRKHLPEKFYMEKGQRKDLREAIFREVIGNLIVHREYTDARSSDLIITQKDVVTTNPNNPIFHGPLDPKRFTPYPKNPNIRKFFTAFGWTDEIGSGVRNTNKYLKHYVPGAEPLFVENELFRIQIPMIFVTLAIFFQPLHNWLDLPTESQSHLENGLQHIQLDSAFESIGFSELILHLVPSWNEKGTKLPELKWPDKQILTKADIKKVPGWNKKGTRLMHKKIVYLIKILILTSKPLELDKIMTWIDYKNRKSFRDNYLFPLQKVGFLTLTIPENPSDPNQKYSITEKGKLFLARLDF